MTTTIPIDSRPAAALPADVACIFLLDYSVALFGAGATCIRLETNVRRIASAMDLKVEITVMPRHIHLTVCDGQAGVTRIATVGNACVDFNLNTQLSALSWAVHDRKLTPAQAIERLKALTTHARRQDPLLLLLLVGIANASFCRLFGGDIAAMITVALATMAGYRVKQKLVARGTDVRVIMIVCAFVSSVLGATAALFSLGSTPEIAESTSVLYLVPGIPFLNSFSDLLYRHYICAFSRLCDALVLTCCITIGLCGGMALMNIGMF